MEFENKVIYVNNSDDSEETLNLRELSEKYSYHWKWFIMAVVISLGLAFLYLKTTKNQYSVSTTIFIDDKDSGGLTSEMSAFEDLGVMNSEGKTKIINEIGVLKSRTLMESVVRKLRLNISYFKEDDFVTKEIYGNEVPLKINFFIRDSILERIDTIFKVSIQSKSKYILVTAEDEIIKEALFGENVLTEFGEINITPNDINNIKTNESTLINISNINAVTNKYMQKLEIVSESKKSSLLTLSLIDEVKSKAISILNSLVIEYNRDAINYKSMITQNTDRFINDRINDISIDLSDVDRGVEEFKTLNKLTDIGYEAGLVLASNAELQKKINQLSSQKQLVDFVIKHIDENKDDLIPANLGINDMPVGESSLIYNKLLLERDRIVKGSSPMNPTVINLDEQLSTLRQSIKQSLYNFRSSIEFSLDKAKNEEYRLNVKRNLAPRQEREFQDIKRKQQIIETLYLYLLKKREENAISIGIPVPNAKLIDTAFGSNIPVSPNSKMVYIVAVFFGIAIPFIVISLISVFDNKIHTQEDLESILTAPVLGDIPKTKSKKKVVTNERDNSSISEAFRLLRTNLNFMLSNEINGGKIIFITSTVGGEGKTFIGINLAAVLVSANNKVLLIGADLRKPKVDNYLEMDIKKGLTHYLSGMESKISNLIVTDEKTQVDILLSGEVPPNPSELLMNSRFEEVMIYGKQNYDYVIVDTPPVSLVTDTLLLSKYADLFIYIVRANYLDKRLLRTAKAMYDDKRLPNMALLLNAADHKKKGYGYAYGY